MAKAVPPPKVQALPPPPAPNVPAASVATVTAPAAQLLPARYLTAVRVPGDPVTVTSTVALLQLEPVIAMPLHVCAVASKLVVPDVT